MPDNMHSKLFLSKRRRVVERQVLIRQFLHRQLFAYALADDWRNEHSVLRGVDQHGFCDSQRRPASLDDPSSMPKRFKIVAIAYT